MACDIGPLETSERAHPDIIELREQKSVNEVASVDRKLRIVDRLLRDLKSRRARTQKTAPAAPFEFGFQFLCPRDEIGRSNRNRLCPSITSGSRPLIRLVRRLMALLSDSSVFFASTIITSSQPVLSESAMLMM